MFLIFAIGSVRGNTVPRAVFPLYTPLRKQGVERYEAGSVLDNMTSEDCVIQYNTPVASEYQEIHP